MPLRSNLMQSGAAPSLARAICGQSSGALTLAGTLQADAVALPAAVNIIGTASANQGGILRADLNVGEEQVVINTTGATIKVYPPIGGKINGGSANAAVSIPTLKRADFMCTTAGLDFYYTISG